MIQIRNVSDDLHRLLKSRAALSGMTLSAFLEVELRRIAERPSRVELLERLRKRGAVELPEPADCLVAAERLSR